MGLTSFKGELPSINDIEIAKNYLTEEELRMLNNLVSCYFDFAEFNAMKYKPMKMKIEFFSYIYLILMHKTCDEFQLPL